MNPGMPPLRDNKFQIPRPKSIKEIPPFLKTLIFGFLGRLFYIFKLIWDTNPLILIGMSLLTLFNGIIPVAHAYINAYILNALASILVSNIVFNSIIWIFVLKFILTLFERIVTSVDNIINRIAGELVTNHIKVELMNKAKKIDLSRFDLPDFYEKLENANREAGIRPVQILNSTFKMISSIISMVSFIIVLSGISGWAPIIIILMALPSSIISFIYRRKNFNYMRHRSKDRREMQYFSSLMTNKDLVKEIRILSLGDTVIGRYQNVFSRYYKGLKKLIVNEGVWNISLSVLKAGVSFGLLLYIASKVFENKIQIGDYSLYSGALNSISTGVSTLITTTATIYEGSLFIDNVIAFMNEESCIRPSLEKPLSPVRGVPHTIAFENVSFSYPGVDRKVLKNISFTLNPGETAALVGLNGAGKTTLIKLLTRLYDPTEGRILLDGRDICEYSLDEYYRMFGIIFQDFGKYAVDVTDNIAFGDICKEPSIPEISKAARRSGANSFIERLPDEYDTPLMRIFEVNGIELSIGQWQKLAIARAFFSDSDIIILDEPTASLDALAEQEIFKQFDELRKNKITLFVSHRLSSATIASKILVIDDGILVEEGTHSELMSMENGIYHMLFNTQASRYMQNEQD